MEGITIYTTAWCGYCTRAKADDPGFRARLFDLTGGWTVPQVLIGGRPVGGYSELRQLERDGRLERLLAA